MVLITSLQNSALFDTGNFRRGFKQRVNLDDFDTHVV